MERIILLLAALTIAGIMLACGSPGTNNSNVYLTNSNSTNADNSSNMPVDNPINANINSNVMSSPASNTTAAVNTATPVARGATPTPGIPANANRPLRPGATPTPGIPDQETIRRQMQGLDTTNLNAAPSANTPMMMKRKGVRRPGNVNQ